MIYEVGKVLWEVVDRSYRPSYPNEDGEYEFANYFVQEIIINRWIVSRVTPKGAWVYLEGAHMIKDIWVSPNSRKLLRPTLEEAYAARIERRCRHIRYLKRDLEHAGKQLVLLQKKLLELEAQKTITNAS